MQFGFGFRYKGWENSIRATGILKQKYPNVFFTGLFTESPYAKVEHQTYYNELMTLVDQLELRNNVAILRGYQSDAVLDSFLRTNQVTVFPYVSHPDHEVFGASGAARMAMSKGLPVITSSVNHFSDLCSIKADTPEQLANELDKLFSNPALIKEQVERQKVYAEDNSWANVALRHIKIFEE
jgi:glycosyltransferase involved in cell wall biosynthesis